MPVASSPLPLTCSNGAEAAKCLRKVCEAPFNSGINMYLSAQSAVVALTCLLYSVYYTIKVILILIIGTILYYVG